MIFTSYIYRSNNEIDFVNEQDSSEVFEFLVNKIETEQILSLKRALADKLPESKIQEFISVFQIKSGISSLFNFSYAKFLVCSACDSRTPMDEADDYQFRVAYVGCEQEEYSLLEAIKSNMEVFRSRDVTQCPKCEQPDSCQEEVTFKSLPRYFIVCLQRSGNIC